MFPQNQMNQNATASAAQTESNNQQTETVAIDLNARVKVNDPTKDFNVVPPPPKAGVTIVQWELPAEKGIDPRASAKVGTFLQCHFVGRVVDEGSEYNGYVVNDYMNSVYSQLKGTSPLHHFMNCTGAPLTADMSIQEMIDAVKAHLATKPLGTINLEWSTSYLDKTNPRANKDGYVTLYNRMTQFPRLPDGSYSNSVSSPVDATPLYARAYVESHLKK